MKTYLLPAQSAFRLIFTMYFKHMWKIIQKHAHLLSKSLTHWISRKEDKFVRLVTPRGRIHTHRLPSRAQLRYEMVGYFLSGDSLCSGGNKGAWLAHPTILQHNTTFASVFNVQDPGSFLPDAKSHSELNANRWCQPISKKLSRGANFV
jgi:hypothetical protein